MLFYFLKGTNGMNINSELASNRWFWKTKAVREMNKISIAKAVD